MTALTLARTEFAEGMWAGVELQKATGKNDGSVNGVRYFSVAPNHGVFVRPDLVCRDIVFLLLPVLTPRS